MSANTYTSDNVAVQYQHYLLLLKELQQEQYEKEYQDFITGLIKDSGMLDDLDASPESLANIDLAMASANVSKIARHCPQAFEAVSKKIFDDADTNQLLLDAGIDITDNAAHLPQSFSYDIAIIAAYEREFPDDKTGPSLKERLGGAKEALLGAASTDAGKALISTTMFAVAVGVSGVGLPIATALFATKLMENKAVQDVMTAMQNKTSNALVALGFKREAVNERSKSLGDKMKDISESTWFKRAKIPLVAASVLLGVGSLAALQFDVSMDDIKTAMGSVGSMSSDAADALSNVGAIGLETAKEGLDIVASGAQAFVNTVDIGVLGQAAIDIGYNAYETGLNIIDNPTGISIDQTVDALASSHEAPVVENTEEFINGIVVDALLDSGFDVPLSAFEESFSMTDYGLPEADVAASQHSPSIHTESPLGTTPDNLEATTEAATEEVEVDIPEVVVYEVEKGDTLWGMAEKHYLETTGHEATPQQITQMINDLNMENPEMIHPGDKIEFSTDLSQYDNVKHVHADWLDQPETKAPAPEESVTGVSPEMAAAAKECLESGKLQGSAFCSEVQAHIMDKFRQDHVVEDSFPHTMSI